MGNDNFKTNFK